MRIRRAPHFADHPLSSVSDEPAPTGRQSIDRPVPRAELRYVLTKGASKTISKRYGLRRRKSRVTEITAQSTIALSVPCRP